MEIEEMKEFECGYNVVKLREQKRKDILCSLEKQLAESSGVENVKLPKDFKIYKPDCFIENKCNNQVYVDGRLYCVNQLEK